MHRMIPKGAEQPVHIRYTAQQGPRADVIADLPGSDKQVQRTSQAVANSVEFGIHAALRPANQTSTPPFFAPMLVAVRWAFR